MDIVKEYWNRFGIPTFISVAFTLLVWVFLLGGKLKELEIAYQHAVQAQQCVSLLASIQSRLDKKADIQYVDAQIRLLRDGYRYRPGGTYFGSNKPHDFSHSFSDPESQ